MRCDKMRATIAVKQCLSNQRKLAGEGPFARSLRYPGCKDCATGRMAVKGKLNDDDLREILDGYHNRMHPPTDVVTAAETGTLKRAHDEKPKEEAVMEKETPKEKRCVRCGKTKPLEEFCRLKKSPDGHRGHCLACNRIDQNEYTRKKRERKRAEAAERERMRLASASLLTPDASPTEKQAEPAPARESTAPTCPQSEDQVLQESHGQDARATSNQLILDFSCYPEVLKEIKRIAHHEERPPEVQARFMLKRLLQLDHEGKERLGFDSRVYVDGQPVPSRLKGIYQPMFLGMDAAKGKDETVCS